MATTYMNLSLPTVSVTTGPTWATMLNTIFNTLDAHDHTIGNGKPLTQAAFTISGNLNLNFYELTNTYAIQFDNLDIGTSMVVPNSLFVRNGNLCYLSSEGEITITTGGSLSVIAGTFTAYIGGTIDIDTDLSAILIADLKTTYLVDTTSIDDEDPDAYLTITLPHPGVLTPYRVFKFVDSLGLTATKRIKLQVTGDGTIQNGSSYIINSAYEAVELISDGISNYIIA